MLQITLKVPTELVDENGPVLEEKVYRQIFISGMAFRKTVAMKKKLAALDVPEDEKIDLLVDYIVELFGNQFTREDYYNGIGVEMVIKAATERLETVVNLATKAIGAQPDPNVK